MILRCRVANHLFMLLALMGCSRILAAQVYPTPTVTEGDPNYAYNWAQWLNSQMPQAVPQETVSLGGIQWLNFNGAPTGIPGEFGAHMTWADLPMNQAPSTCPNVPPGTNVQAPVVLINSFNEQFQLRGGCHVLTVDGQNWQEVGNDVRGDVVFTSPTKGFRGYGNIYETLDGGNTWKQVFTCAARVVVHGLTQQITCGVNAIQFATRLIGYGVGDSSVLGGGVVVKTNDGGSTWNVIYLPQESGDQRTNFASFLDENRGFAFRNAGLYRTMDGGRSWLGAAAPPSNSGALKFADPEVGWSLGGGYTQYLLYTVDSGNHWTSRQLNAPAPIHGFSLPHRDTAYIVGDHGMIYRYRVVPLDYSVANMIPAPLMPGYDSPLNGELATVRSRASALAAQMQTSLGISAPPQLVNSGSVGGASSTDGASVQYAAASPTGQNPTPTGFQQPAQTSGQYTAQGGLPQSTTSSLPSDASQVGFQQAPQASQPSTDQSGFQQDTGTSPTNAARGSQQPPFSTGPGANQAAFQQTTGQPMGGVVASCCGSALRTLESAANVFATDLPMFSGKFRNLNLITAGLQFINDLLQRTNALKLAINNLGQAPDKQSAAAALGALSGQLNGIPADVNGGFVQDTSSAFPPQAAQVPTSFAGTAQQLNQSTGNQAVSGQPSAAQPPNAQSPNAQPAAQAANPADQLDKATQTVKDKLKKKLPW